MISKKVILSIAVLTIMAQLVFTLVQNTGFSFAQAVVAGDIPLAPSSLMQDTSLTTSSSIAIKWVNNSTIADHFNIERKKTTATDWSAPWSTQITGSAVTSYFDSSVTPGTYYDYRVQACRSTYGCSDYVYLIGVASLSSGSNIPLSPSGLMQDSTETSPTVIRLVWTNNSTNQDKFNIDKAIAGSGNYSISTQITNSTLTSYTDNLVTSGTSYDYRVQACHSGYGCSDYAYIYNIRSASSIECLLTVSLNSATPSARSVSQSESGVSLVKFNLHSNCAITLNSFAVSLLPMPNGYLNISSLRLYKDGTQIGSTLNNPVAGANFSGLNLAIGAGQTIVLEAKGDISSSAIVGSAVYGVFGGSSASSDSGSVGNNASGNVVAGNTMTIVAGSVSPLPPASVTATSSTEKIVVSWPASTSATGYSIYRSVNGGGYSYLIDTTTLAYNDFNVVAGSVYRYKVLGCDASHTCLLAGTESNSVTYIGSGTTCTGLNLTINDADTTYNIGYDDPVNFTWTCTPGGTASNVYMKLYRSSDGALALTLPNGPANIGTETRYLSTSSLSVGSYILKVCFDSSCATAAASKTFTAVSGTTATSTPTPASTAVPTPTPFVTPYITASIGTVSSVNYTSPTIVSGAKQPVSILSNFSFPSGSLNFYLYKYSSAGIVDTSVNYYNSAIGNISPVFASDGKKWEGILYTPSLSNGNYKFFAQGYVNTTIGTTLTETAYTSNYVYFKVDNSAVVSPSPAVTPATPTITTGIESSVSGSIVSGVKTLWANSTVPLTGGVTFSFYNTAANAFPMYTVIGYPSKTTAPDAFGNYNYWLGNLDTAKLANGSYKLIAKGIYNAKPYENTVGFYFNVNNPVTGIAPAVTPLPVAPLVPVAPPSPFPVVSPAVNPNLSPLPAVSPYPLMTPDMSYYPAECQEKGYTTPEACNNYMQFPPECRNANILDTVKCPEYMFKNAMPEICRQKGITTQEECTKIIILNSFPQQCKDANITDEAKCMSFMNSNTFLTAECKEANISDFSACGIYMAEKFMPKECVDAGAKTKEECDYIMRSKYSNFAQSTAIEMKAPYPPQGIGGIPQECRDQNVTDPAGCEKIMTAKYLPEDCKAANITAKADCEKFLFEKNAPRECINEKISNPKDCEIFIFKMNAPQDCIDAGMLSPEGCKKFMFEKYSDKKNIPPDKFPIECQKAGIKTIDECEKVMTQSYLPEECKKNGISDSDKCDMYLKQKYMPEECRQAGVNTQKECDIVMFKKYAPDECKKAGISNEKECKDYIFNLYAPKATCQGLDELQCKNAIKENYLGAITSKQMEYTKVRDEIVPLAGGDAVSVEDLRKKIGDGEEIIPIKDKDASLKIVKTKEDLVLNEDKDLVQTAGAAVMVDTDNDGLSDDMEKRIGTDPANPDTDKDGIKDGEEVKSGYNPLGEGKMPEDMKEKITPIDEAILNEQTLDHPKTTGTESDSYSFDKISNIEADQSGAAGGKYLFQGKAAGDSVVTLYIYSDLPIVVTVKTDKYGNWNYEFDKSLMDGGHEAYVALNDNAGRVVTRSAVMSFFVNEAKAVSVMDFVSPASAAAPVKESEKAMTSYAFMTMAIIFVGIIIFIGLIIVLRRRSSHSTKA